MGIDKVISVIPEIAGKCRVWGHGKVVNSCLEAGQDFVKIARENGGKLTLEELNRVYKKVLPKGCNIQAVSDPEAAKTFLRGLNFGEDTVSLITDNAQAFVIKNYKGEILFFAPIEKFAGDKAVNVATHEFEHALNNAVTLRAKVKNLLYKVLGPKRVEKMELKDSEAENMKIMRLHRSLMEKLGVSNPLEGTIAQSADTNGLLDYLGVRSKKRLSVQLRKAVRKILTPEAERKNVKHLKAIRATLSDEVRAFRAGGQTAKEYLGMEEGSTMSEMASQLYDETVSVIKKEIKAQRKKGIKRALGMKVRDYENIKTNEVDLSEMFEKLIAALKNGEVKTVKLSD